jgi:hypothetical protein
MTTESSGKLLPCPFCGGPAVNVGGDYIKCGAPYNMDGCCPGLDCRATPEDWNTRQNEAEQRRVQSLNTSPERVQESANVGHEVPPELVELVAKAIAHTQYHEDDFDTSQYSDGVEYVKREWKMAIPHAKAALDAIPASYWREV